MQGLCNSLNVVLDVITGSQTKSIMRLTAHLPDVQLEVVPEVQPEVVPEVQPEVVPEVQPEVVLEV